MVWQRELPVRRDIAPERQDIFNALLFQLSDHPAHLILGGRYAGKMLSLIHISPAFLFYIYVSYPCIATVWLSFNYKEKQAVCQRSACFFILTLIQFLLILWTVFSSMSRPRIPLPSSEPLQPEGWFRLPRHIRRGIPCLRSGIRSSCLPLQEPGSSCTRQALPHARC